MGLQAAMQGQTSLPSQCTSYKSADITVFVQLAADYWHYRSLACLSSFAIPWERYWALIPAQLQSSIPNCHYYKMKLRPFNKIGAGQFGAVA